MKCKVFATIILIAHTFFCSGIKPTETINKKEIDFISSVKDRRFPRLHPKELETLRGIHGKVLNQLYKCLTNNKGPDPKISWLRKDIETILDKQTRLHVSQRIRDSRKSLRKSNSGMYMYDGKPMVRHCSSEHNLELPKEWK